MPKNGTGKDSRHNFSLDTHSEKDTLQRKLRVSALKGDMEGVRKAVATGADTCTCPAPVLACLSSPRRGEGTPPPGRSSPGRDGGGSSINAPCSWGSPAFLRALQEGDRDSLPGIVRLFVSLGARVDTPDDDGMTPLLYVAYHNSVQFSALLLDTLIELGADINAAGCPGFASGGGPQTALLSIALDGALSNDLLMAFIRHGANLNAQNGAGDTVLHVLRQTACLNPAHFRILIAHGLNLSIRNNEGKVALSPELNGRRYGAHIYGMEALAAGRRAAEIWPSIKEGRFVEEFLEAESLSHSPRERSAYILLAAMDSLRDKQSGTDTNVGTTYSLAGYIDLLTDTSPDPLFGLLPGVTEILSGLRRPEIRNLIPLFLEFFSMDELLPGLKKCAFLDKPSAEVFVDLLLKGIDSAENAERSSAIQVAKAIASPSLDKWVRFSVKGAEELANRVAGLISREEQEGATRKTGNAGGEEGPGMGITF